MTSLYNVLFDDIPMFVVPGTENSDVIEYETNEQRNVRLINEMKVKQTLEEIRRLEIQLLQVELIGPLRQRRLPDATQARATASTGAESTSFKRKHTSLEWR